MRGLSIIGAVLSIFLFGSCVDREDLGGAIDDMATGFEITREGVAAKYGKIGDALRNGEYANISVYLDDARAAAADEGTSTRSYERNLYDWANGLAEADMMRNNYDNAIAGFIFGYLIGEDKDNRFNSSNFMGLLIDRFHDAMKEHGRRDEQDLACDAYKAVISFAREYAPEKVPDLTETAKSIGCINP